MWGRSGSSYNGSIVERVHMEKNGRKERRQKREDMKLGRHSPAREEEREEERSKQRDVKEELEQPASLRFFSKL